MASIKNRVENLEKKSGANDGSPYIGFPSPEYTDVEVARAAWIAEHGEPLEGQHVIWVNFVKPDDRPD